jgi:hypothetical protein
MRVTDIYMAFLSFNDFVFTEEIQCTSCVLCSGFCCKMRVLRGAYDAEPFFSTALYALRYTLRGLVEKLSPYISHCFRACVCHYAISEPDLSSAMCKDLYRHNGVCGTSPHVLRFTGFGHRRERRRLE